jgi:hypothetical protein
MAAFVERYDGTCADDVFRNNKMHGVVYKEVLVEHEKIVYMRENIMHYIPKIIGKKRNGFQIKHIKKG